MKHALSRARHRARMPGGIAAAVALGLLATGCGSSVKGSSAGGGSAPTPGYDASTKTFTVDALEPLTGPIGVSGVQLITGMRLYFDTVNHGGGIDGKYKVKFAAQDSQFNTQVAVPIYNRVKGSTAIFSGILGTNILGALTPQLAADQLTAVPDATGASLVHQPNLLPWGTSSQANAINLLAYAANKLGDRHATFCSMTGPDSNGADSRQGDAFAVKKLGLKWGVGIEPSYATTNFTPQIQQLKKAGCQVVMYGMITATTTGTMAAAAQLGFTAQWVGQNNSWVPAFAHTPVAGYMAKHFLTTLGPVSWDSPAPGMVALRAAVKKYAPGTQPSQYTEEGFAHAMFVTAVLRKAIAAHDFTRAGILHATRSLGTFSYQGLLPDFGYGPPAQRKPASTTAIYRVAPSRPLGLAPVSRGYGSPAAAQYPYPNP